MTAAEFEALKAKLPEGSIVYLKAGSPRLTVEWTRTDGFVPVFWFDTFGQLHRDVFAPEALDIVNIVTA